MLPAERGRPGDRPIVEVGAGPRPATVGAPPALIELAGSVHRHEVALAARLAELDRDPAARKHLKPILLDRIRLGPLEDALRCLALLDGAPWSRRREHDDRLAARVELLVLSAGLRASRIPELGRWLWRTREPFEALVRGNARRTRWHRAVSASLLAVSCDELPPADRLPAALDAVGPLLHHGSEWEWIPAARAVGAWSSTAPEAARFLRHGLKERDATPRRRALAALAFGARDPRRRARVLGLVAACRGDLWAVASIASVLVGALSDAGWVEEVLEAASGPRSILPVEAAHAMAQTCAAGGIAPPRELLRRLASSGKEAAGHKSRAQRQLAGRLGRLLAGGDAAEGEQPTARALRLVEAAIGPGGAMADQVVRAPADLAARLGAAERAGDHETLRDCARMAALAPWRAVARAGAFDLAGLERVTAALHAALLATAARLLASAEPSHDAARAALDVAGAPLDASDQLPSHDAVLDRGQLAGRVAQVLASAPLTAVSGIGGPWRAIWARLLDVVEPTGGEHALAAWWLAVHGRPHLRARDLPPCLAEPAPDSFEGVARSAGAYAHDTPWACASGAFAAALAGLDQAAAAGDAGSATDAARSLDGALPGLAACVADPRHALRGTPVTVARPSLPPLIGFVRDERPSREAAEAVLGLPELIGPVLAAIAGAVLASARSELFEGGRRIGPYRVVPHALPRGGQGDVHVVERAGRRYLLKIARRYVEPLQREIEALRAIHHENVVGLVDWSRPDASVPYVVLPLLVGADLHCFCGLRVLSVAELAPIVRDVGRALEVLHANGRVHGDVKPSNVFLTLHTTEGAALAPAPRHRDLPVCSAKLIDLGSSAAAGSLQDPRAGTPGYLAPEQVGRRPIGAETDVYGLAATLYTALTGRVLFPANPFLHASTEPFAVDGEARAHVEPAVADLLHDATRLAPEDRSSLDELTRRFAALAAHDHRPEELR